MKRVVSTALVSITAVPLVLAGLAGCGPDGPPGPDASVDAPSDAPKDVAVDAPKDAGKDATADADAAADADAKPDAADAIADSAGEAGNDASLDGTADATVDGATDASNDAPSDGGLADVGSDAPSAVCGNGIREPAEECDDAVQSVLLDSCSSLCEVRDLLAHRVASDAGLASRTLGLGRHPMAGSAGGFAVSWIEPVGPRLGMTFYDAKGIPSGAVDRFAVGSTPLISSAPVVAALPGNVYAVAYTDLGGDGDAEGIALRRVDPNVASSGAPAHANAVATFSQYDADILWTGAQLVVAWADTSNVSTGPDLRVRTFDANLNPTSSEQTLAGSSAIEESVALATFAGGWAAAWREASGGLETIRAKAGNVAFSVGPFLPGPYDAPPGLAELDATHLLVTFIEGSKLRGAVLDTAQPGATNAFDIAPLTQGLNPPAAIWSSAVRAGSRIFASWSSEAVIADPRAEEAWLKELSWNGSALDLTRAEIPLPRWDNHRLGDQRFPAMTAVGSDLASAWVDLGNTFPSSANGDVAVEFSPLPILRKLNADGGGL